MKPIDIFYNTYKFIYCIAIIWCCFTLYCCLLDEQHFMYSFVLFDSNIDAWKLR